MLDVLIVGSGPHALTLATLLSHPDPHSIAPNKYTLEGVQQNRSKLKHAHLMNSERDPTTETAVGEGVVSGLKPLPLVDFRGEEGGASGPPHPLPNFRVVDSYGQWAALWESQFQGLNIGHLRSHALVHTDPVNKKALLQFALEQGRSTEFRGLPERVRIQDENAFFNDSRLGRRERRRLGVGRALQRSPAFSLPSVQLSVDFFRAQVQRYGLDRVLLTGTVDRIFPVLTPPTGVAGTEAPPRKVLFFRVLLHGGEIVETYRVVLATGPTRAHMANIPAWAAAVMETFPEDRLQHTVQLMHPQSQSAAPPSGHHNTCPPAVCQPAERVMVVGGGLTSAHVITIAFQQGACHVTWVMRKHLQLKQFDVGDVESLVGRYAHVERGVKLDGLAYLRQFYSERSLHRRLAMIRQARKGGAVTPEAYVQLRPFIQSGCLAVRTQCEVSDAEWCYRNQVWKLSLSCGELWTGDRVWLATGCKLDVNQDPLLADVMKEFPVQTLDGWPCVSENLQWAPGCPLYLMGQYSALQVGPHAVNLAGGQAASMRIAKHILRHHLGEEASDEPGSKKTRVEEYVQQMHGLMWL